MAQAKTSTARRREVRRNLPKSRPGWRELSRRPEFGWALLYAAVFAVYITISYVLGWWGFLIFQLIVFGIPFVVMLSLWLAKLYQAAG